MSKQPAVKHIIKITKLEAVGDGLITENQKLREENKRVNEENHQLMHRMIPLRLVEEHEARDKKLEAIRTVFERFKIQLTNECYEAFKEVLGE